MLLKLMRYEFKSNYIKFVAACILNLIIVIIFSLIPSTKGVAPFLAGFIALIAFNIIGFIFIFQRYARSLYSCEGYLTFMLPVKSYEILLSKLLVASFWTILFSMESIGNICLIAYSLDNSSLAKMIGIILKNIPSSLFTILYFIAGTFFNIITLYFSISFSKFSLWRKFGTLMGIIAFVAISAISTAPIYFIDTYVKTFTKQNELSRINSFFLSFNNYTLVEFIIISAFSMVLFFITCYILDKKTDLK